MRRTCFVLSLLIVIWPAALSAQRAIPDDNLAYPVLINLTDCDRNVEMIKGTGFYLDNGSEFYLVTARHVLFNETVHLQPGHERPLLCGKAELLSYSKNPSERQQNRILLDLRVLNAAGKVRAHPTHDVAVIQIGLDQNGPILPLSGVQIVQAAPSGLLSANISTLKKLEGVLTANDVYVFGYPSSIGIQESQQIDYSSPLLRKGIVAGINISKKTIILDCLTFQGNSGGPVLEAVHEAFATRFSVIGVVVQYVPTVETWVNTTFSYYNMQIHNSGYTVAEPMDFVLELVGK